MPVSIFLPQRAIVAGARQDHGEYRGGAGARLVAGFLIGAWLA